MTKTALVLLNMGGPRDQLEVGRFLSRLFHDGDLIPLPFQSILAPWIAKRRTPKIQDQYQQIGGGSPILHWTKRQGDLLVKLLNERSPETGNNINWLILLAPHQSFVSFRYAEPLTDQTVDELKKQGIQRAVALSLYPQYSCSTTGSSLNELVRNLKKKDPEQSIRWSVIDRWASSTALAKAFAAKIKKALLEYSPDDRKRVILLFSAHSLPMSVVNRGDPYPAEVAATVDRVMQELNYSIPYRLVWQSQVPHTWALNC
jgi:ferrochelatase